MQVQPNLLLRLISIAALVGVASCSRDGARNPLGPASLSAPSAASGLNATRTITIPFNSSNFTAGAPNVYFPLVPGTRYAYRQETPEGVETDTVDVTGDTKTILGVATTVVHDRVYLEGALQEDTFDWYASDNDGNVWYFGEDTKEIPTGSTTGSWEAGQAGAQPGIIMLAHPMVGDTYQQENSPGVVADMARVKGLDETAVTPFATYTGCLKTQEWTPIEPGSRAFKFYAPNVGTVVEDENKSAGPVLLTLFVTP
jgi:hypothetical protein